MKRLIILFVILISIINTYAAKVDTLKVMSKSMNKIVLNIVIIPDKSEVPKNGFPVVYLLHGATGNQNDWIKNVPAVKDYADQYQLMIVCPDGGFTSWYFDSPVDSAFQYESYITRDLLTYIDTHYSTTPDRSARAITGLSMGGHGALYLSIRNPKLFGSAGSMSGGVDLRASPKMFDIAKRIGSIESNLAEWDNRSVINMVNNLKNDELNLIIDCGISDFFYLINAGLHRRLMSLKIDHDYIERPGEHNWQYWSNSIRYQFLYFERCFQKGKK